MTIPHFLKQRPEKFRALEPIRIKHSKDDTHGNGWAVGYSDDTTGIEGTICVIWDNYRTNKGRHWSDVEHDSVEPE